ncbi:DEAD/DEAH box helicase [Paenibacillus pseudetheri]|uniref:Primosomal protein N n=1 Tax=Paenibacillus pseudetheri TaxID=2897682 RepID=A0ABN8F892_9BACL|nr:helicase-related protein [Paenibacillus pseudetheri]CAH1054250.1 primosomal protein N' [Paenibacillus pseudetheri]
MQVAVYALECRGFWSAWISLDLTVDRWWRSGAGPESQGRDLVTVDKLVLLSPALPLGWAVKLRDRFKQRDGMRNWGAKEWGQYVSSVLEPELKEEREAGGIAEEEWLSQRVSLWRASELRGGFIESSKKNNDCRGNDLDYALLESEVEQLVHAVAGRSLLQPEIEALLAEGLPELTGRWRQAAQLAHLQGRLTFAAAVGSHAPAAHGAWARQLPASAGALARAAARLPHVLWRGAVARRAISRCLRCGSAPTGRTACAACGLMGCAYCEACLALGRSRACALLLRSAALPAVRCTAALDPTVAAGRWGLSPAQAGAAGAALGFLAERRERSAKMCPERFLLWAVTGAGKTEMIFPLLEAVLAAGGRALVATPRRDVVLELAPRLAKAFPAEILAVLYGGSTERWVSGRLTLATTHQLLRFHRAFDLVIIDELDAFPYHNDPMLAYAAEQACKVDGSFIYLSATPPQEMQRLVRSGRLPHARVPVRFHGHPLPVPQHLTMTSVQTCLKRGILPRSLIHTLRKSLEREAQIFCFVSRIAHIEGLLVLLRRSFPGVVIEGTSSKDPFRAEKVTAFRNRAISLLVTTTILERGVTVPRSDVFILDADSDLFDEASLVQMAGRAGRSKDDPAGRVVFASPQWTRSQRGAISQIRTMNIIARRKGYISKEAPR